MPFLNNVLEYNVFDPTEVVPEFTADVGTKRGEKVDYAVMKDGNPIILFECKKVGANLAIRIAALSLLGHSSFRRLDGRDYLSLFC